MRKLLLSALLIISIKSFSQVTFTHLSLCCHEKATAIFWETENTKGVKFYIVEVSIDGETWLDINFRKADTTAFYTIDPGKGVYYRVGAFYSNEKKVYSKTLRAPWSRWEKTTALTIFKNSL